MINNNKFKIAAYVTMAAIYIYFMTSLIASCIENL